MLLENARFTKSEQKMSSLEDLGRRESVEESEKRRILRSAILDLTDQAQQDDLRLDPELIKKSNQLAAQIKEVPEALLDSRLAVILGQKAVKASSKLSISGVNYNTSDFLMHLRRILSGRSSSSSKASSIDNFCLLSRMVPRRDARPKTPIAGSFNCDDLKEKQVRRRAAMQSQRTEGRTEVRQIASTDGLEEPTTKAVDRIFRAIRKLHDKGLMPVDFFEFVIDPESFSATVENIFHLSFLVKQNQVAFNIDDEGGPSLSFVTSQQTTQKRNIAASYRRSTGRSQKEERTNDQDEPLRSRTVYSNQNDEEEQVDCQMASGDCFSQVDYTVIASISFREWQDIVEAYGLTGKSIIKRLGGSGKS
ncbi:non-structural maintenance of chromosome element 4-like isoform X1 [Varroa jacobsoni]|uniref:non-structural maintenance of chromosome element 4-like isoform X1 n=2 Tax=Varroa jacobsoni TaxID=62625 RepID=UPI000BF86288|nr:non-structural maintenance of chromosome element 4-like isoform X1 [Varroa jacobsoni]